MQVMVEFVVLAAQAVDGLDGMDDGGVVTTTKGIADFREAVLGDFAA